MVSSSFFGGFQFLATLDGLVRLLSGQFAAAIAFSSDHLVLDPAVARRSSGTGWALRGKRLRRSKGSNTPFPHPKNAQATTACGCEGAHTPVRPTLGDYHVV